jgi:hypothetical protein
MAMDFPLIAAARCIWAENAVGLKVALEKLRKYSAQTGGTWLKVSPLLEQLVAEGRGFASVGA